MRDFPLILIFLNNHFLLIIFILIFKTSKHIKEIFIPLPLNFEELFISLVVSSSPFLNSLNLKKRKKKKKKEVWSVSYPSKSRQTLSLSFKKHLNNIN